MRSKHMTFFSRVRKYIRKLLDEEEFLQINRHLSVFRSVEDLARFFGWDRNVVFFDEHTDERPLVVDINNRRRIDAEILSIIARNTRPEVCLEIGTSTGVSTARIALNSPQATVYTVNIPPEDYRKGGAFTTHRLNKEKIGQFYRNMKLTNISQIFANTMTWNPDIPPVDLAFIDGSHDTEFVYNDTRKILKYLNAGGWMLWHDFNPDLYRRFEWIRSVMTAIELLYRENKLKGNIYHVKDSWIAMCQIGGKCPIK